MQSENHRQFMTTSSRLCRFLLTCCLTSVPSVLLPVARGATDPRQVLTESQWQEVEHSVD
jgi:hypothetical protein